MLESESLETRFGRTVISVIVGDILLQSARAIVVPANLQAQITVNAGTSLRNLSGFQVEQELRAQLPLHLGSAVVTSSGELKERGVEFLIHAVLQTGPGSPIRELDARSALQHSLAMSEHLKVSSLAVPVAPFLSTRLSEDLEIASKHLVDTLVQHLRRRPSRIERLLLVTPYEGERRPLGQLLATTRERDWQPSL